VVDEIENNEVGRACSTYRGEVHTGFLVGKPEGRRPFGRFMRWAGHVAHTGERRGAYRVLVGKPEGRRQFGRSRRRWKDKNRSLTSAMRGYGFC
jgi:hypothetical protein